MKEININDAPHGWLREAYRSVNFVDRYRWVLLKLDLCSITVILRPRVLLIPARYKPTRDVRECRDDFIYTRRKPASHVCTARRGVAAQQEEEKGRKKERVMERKVKKTLRIFRRVPVQFVSHFISGRKRSHLSPRPELPANSANASSMHARSIHPRGTTATWIILIFAPAKVSQRDYCGATRFHPRETRRGEERRRKREGVGVERPGCDATTSFKYHGKQGPQ